MSDSVAQTALKFAKAYTPHGADNQTTGQTQAPKAWAGGLRSSFEAKATVPGLKEAAPPEGCTMEAIHAYGKAVMGAKAGNCLEQCSLVCLCLSTLPGVAGYSLVRLAQPGDHVFVAIGQAPDTNGFFPDDFGGWSADAVVVDPWVSIAVKARHYPEAWRMKVDVMAAAGQELSSSDGWSLANSPTWANALTANRKRRYTSG